jgi:hypothetical protein
MPESKRRKKEKKQTRESKRRQSALARQNRREIEELRGMLSVLDEWPSEYVDYEKFYHKEKEA